jgi:hypothetical protein
MYDKVATSPPEMEQTNSVTIRRLHIENYRHPHFIKPSHVDMVLEVVE